MVPPDEATPLAPEELVWAGLWSRLKSGNDKL